MHPILQVFHVAGTVVWVGGMFFAHMVLRPELNDQLDGQRRLMLFCSVVRRFLNWASVAVVLIWVSGLAALVLSGFHGWPFHWHLMIGLGLLMTIIYAFINFQLMHRLEEAVSAQHWPLASLAAGKIRQLVGINLILGLVQILVGNLGHMAPLVGH